MKNIIKKVGMNVSLKNHYYYFQEYPKIVLIPLGKKNKKIRSIGHKTDKSILNRLNDALSRMTLSIDERKNLQNFLQIKHEAFLPIMVNKDEKVKTRIINPNFLIWKYFPPNHGIPYQKESFYEEDISKLSNDELIIFLKKVIAEYLFCAELSKKPDNQWIQIIKKAYNQHPFVQLFLEKQEIVDSVEIANRSPLLSVLSPPEDVSYWRQRVEIVLWPYRKLPLWCEHDKSLIVLSSKKLLICDCSFCQKEYHYCLKEDKYLLEENPNMNQAIKRIATIENQFNEIIKKNIKLVNSLEFLVYIKKNIDISKIVKLVNQIDHLPFNITIENQFAMNLIKELSQISVPFSRPASSLLWISLFHIPTIALLKTLNNYSFDEINESFESLQKELVNVLRHFAIKPDETLIKIKKNHLTYFTVARILKGIISLEDLSFHVIAQILKGRTSYSLREQKLDQQFLFGFLEKWEEKDIHKLLKALEKELWITKHSTGFNVSDKGASLINNFDV